MCAFFKFILFSKSFSKGQSVGTMYMVVGKNSKHFMTGEMTFGGRGLIRRGTTVF
jgi:hypothetical protein